MQRLGWVVALILVMAGSAAAQFRGFAVHGEAIPGTSDTIDRVSSAVALGGDSVAYHARGLNAQYIAVDVAGTDTVIATQGATAPDGGTYGTFSDLRAWGTQVSFVSNGTTYLWSVQAGVRPLVLAGLVAVNTAGQTLHLTSTLTFVDTTGTPTVIVAANGPVPGDPTFTVESLGIVSPYLHENGDVTFQLNAADSSLGVFKSYIFQGPASAPVLRESDDTLPSDLGDLRVGLIAASPNGDLAWWTSFGTAGPVSHIEIKLRRNGANTRIAESLDSAPIMIDGAPYSLDLSTVGRHLHFLSTTQLVMYASGASGFLSSVVAYGNGAWHKVATDAEMLPGATFPGTVVVTVVGDRILLTSAGSGGGVWTSTNGAVQTIALTGQMFGAFTATNVLAYEGNDTDGGIIISVAHAGSTAGTRVSGFISSAASANFEITRATATIDWFYRTPNVGYGTDFALTVTNHGPTAASANAIFGVAGLDIHVECTGSGTSVVCPLGEPFAVGETRVIEWKGNLPERSFDVAVGVEPVGVTDPDHTNNEVYCESILVPKEKADGGLCSSGRPTGLLPALAILGLVVLRRRRRAQATRG